MSTIRCLSEHSVWKEEGATHFCINDVDGDGATEVLVWDAPTSSLRVSAKRYEQKEKFDCRSNTGWYKPGDATLPRISVCGYDASWPVYILIVAGIIYWVRYWTKTLL